MASRQTAKQDPPRGNPIRSPPLSFRIHAAPIARFAGHVFGGIALFLVIAVGAVLLGWVVDLLRAASFLLWGVELRVDPLVTQILYGIKVFILFVDVVLLVTFIGTSGLLLWKEMIEWTKS